MDADRDTKIELLYGYLELGIGEGKRLSGEIRKLLKEPPFVQFVKQPFVQAAETKKALIKTALYILTTKEWGKMWFGRGCQTVKSRTLFWPTDSSM